MRNRISKISGKGLQVLGYVALFLIFLASMAVAQDVAIVNSTTMTGTASPLAVSAPASCQVGDVLVAHIENFYASSQPTITNPSGWNTIGSDVVVGSYAVHRTAWHVWAAGETTYSWTFNNTSYNSGGIIAFRYVNPTSPIDATTTASGTSGTRVSTGALTTLVEKSMLVLHASAYGTSARTFSTEQVGGATISMTEQYDTTTGRCANSGSYYLQAAIASSGTSGATLSGSITSWAGRLTSLRPLNRTVSSGYSVASATTNISSGTFPNPATFSIVSATTNVSSGTLPNSSTLFATATQPSEDYTEFNSSLGLSAANAFNSVAPGTFGGFASDAQAVFPSPQPFPVAGTVSEGSIGTFSSSYSFPVVGVTLPISNNAFWDTLSFITGGVISEGSLGSFLSALSLFGISPFDASGGQAVTGTGFDTVVQAIFNPPVSFPSLGQMVELPAGGRQNLALIFSGGVIYSGTVPSVYSESILFLVGDFINGFPPLQLVPAVLAAIGFDSGGIFTSPAVFTTGGGISPANLGTLISSLNYSTIGNIDGMTGNLYAQALTLSVLGVVPGTSTGNFLSPAVFTSAGSFSETAGGNFVSPAIFGAGNSFSGSGAGNLLSSLAFSSDIGGDFQSLGKFYPSLAYSVLGIAYGGYAGANLFALALAFSTLNTISEESLGNLSSPIILTTSNVILEEGKGQFRFSLNFPILTIFGHGIQSSYSSSTFLESVSRMTGFPGTWRLPINPATLKILQEIRKLLMEFENRTLRKQ